MRDTNRYFKRSHFLFFTLHVTVLQMYPINVPNEIGVEKCRERGKRALRMMKTEFTMCVQAQGRSRQNRPPFFVYTVNVIFFFNITLSKTLGN